MMVLLSKYMMAVPDVQTITGLHLNGTTPTHLPRESNHNLVKYITTLHKCNVLKYREVTLTSLYFFIFYSNISNNSLGKTNGY